MSKQDVSLTEAHQRIKELAVHDPIIRMFLRANEERNLSWPTLVLEMLEAQTTAKHEVQRALREVHTRTRVRVDLEGALKTWAEQIKWAEQAGKPVEEDE